jgi:hypothetical protein
MRPPISPTTPSKARVNPRSFSNQCRCVFPADAKAFIRYS